MREIAVWWRHAMLTNQQMYLQRMTTITTAMLTSVFFC